MSGGDSPRLGARRWALAIVGLMVVVAGLAAVPHAVAAPAATSSCPTHGAGFQPADGKTLLIIGQNRDSADAYVDGVGIVPGGFMTYSSVGAPVLGLHLPVAFGAVSHGQHFIDKYPNSVMNVAIQLTPFDVVTSGAYDTNLQILGDWIKATKRPIYLRLGYEFDNPEKANDPAKFIAAWRHVVDHLRGQGVTNAAYVWHSGAKGTFGGRPLSAWYPGDEYVDYMAVSLFRTLQLPYAHQMADLADAHGKPLMIAESTPLGYLVPSQPQVWDEWFVPILDFIDTRHVKIWSYINQNWDKDGGFAWGDSRVEVNPAIKARWLGEVTQPNYLQASPDLYCQELGYGDAAPPPAVPEGRPFLLLGLAAVTVGAAARRRGGVKTSAT